MKKHLILILIAGLFAFTACSDDDDNGTPDNGDRIVGVWTLVSVSPPNQFFNPDACQTPSIIDLQSDGTAEGTFYLESEDCTASEINNGSWEYLGNSEYAIEFPAIGVREGTVDFESDNEFSFTTLLNIEGFNIPVELTFTK